MTTRNDILHHSRSEGGQSEQPPWWWGNWCGVRDPRKSLGVDELSCTEDWAQGPTRHPEHTLCPHSQYTSLVWKTHMWTTTVCQATSSALYQMISFRLLSSEHPAKAESVTEDDTSKPFLGFRIFSTSYYLYLKFFCSNLHQTLLISGKIFFFFWANTTK